jgi:hypothetical protein
LGGRRSTLATLGHDPLTGPGWRPRVLLCGGGKSTQDKDIARAKQMARELKE